MSNAIQVLQVYRHAGCWVFDDDNFGLKAEPFVLGMSEIIDEVAFQHCKHGQAAYRVIFAADPFPGHQGFLEKYDFENGGGWYRLQNDLERVKNPSECLKGWLCPATLHYFPAHPNKIYVKVEDTTQTRAGIVVLQDRIKARRQA